MIKGEERGRRYLTARAVRNASPVQRLKEDRHCMGHEPAHFIHNGGTGAACGQQKTTWDGSRSLHMPGRRCGRRQSAVGAGGRRPSILGHPLSLSSLCHSLSLSLRWSLSSPRKIRFPPNLISLYKPKPFKRFFFQANFILLRKHILCSVQCICFLRDGTLIHMDQPLAMA